MKNLTPKQIAFAHYVVDGLTQTEAYRRAYKDSLNKTSTRRMAHDVRHNPKVAAYIEDIKTIAESIAKGDGVNLRQLESVRMVPVIGSPVYWWTGKGQVKVEARERRLRRRSNYAGR